MKQQIIESVNRFFNAVDKQNWQECERLMTDQVLLDYSSMGAGDAALLAKGDIIGSWKGLLPGFDSTHHQLGNAVVDMEGEDAAHFYSYVTATHFIAGEDGEVWTVVGSYDIKLGRADNLWRINALKLNFKYQSGNQNLSAAAQARV